MTTTNTEARSKRYVQLALTVNPIWQAPQLLHLRHQLLGTKPVYQESTTESSDQVRQRHLLKQRLVAIQHEFWKLPLDQLQTQLKQIDVTRFPELGPLAERLTLAATCRADFPKLAQLPKMDMPLLNAFRAAVVLPPKEAGQVRENFLRTLDSSERLQSAKRGADLISKNYPHLFALEKDWFRTIAQQKQPYSSLPIEYRSQSSGFDFSWQELSWPAILLLIILFRALVTILRMAAS